MPKQMLAATPPRRISQVVDEEGQRDLVQLLDDERVGEAAREGHQVVGGDGAGDSDHACRSNLPGRPGRTAGTAARTCVRVRGPSLGSGYGQLKLSPQAHELPARSGCRW